MRGLNLDQLRTLLTVVESGSFSAAARKLNLSQPAVSAQIRELERRFGVQLLERLGKQAHATPPGRDLVDAAGDIFKACENAEATMRRYRDGWIGRVRIATTITAQMYVLPPILRRLSEDHPGVELHVRNLPSRESVTAILQNEIDLAIVTLPVDQRQLTVTPLWDEPMVAIYPPGARNVPAKVGAVDVMEQPLLLEHVHAGVHQLVMQWLTSQAVSPRVRMHLASIEAVKSAVASNLGMSIVPQAAASRNEDDILIRPLDPPLIRSLALIEHRSKPNEAAIEIVRNALLDLRIGDAEARKPRADKPAAAPAAKRRAEQR